MTPIASRLWQLEAMRAEGPLPAIRWRAYSRPDHTAWGTSWGPRITMRLGPAASIEGAVEVLLHELVHSSCPNRHHGELFCRRLIACAREAFDLDLRPAELLALPPAKGRIAYAIDDVIRERMEAAAVGEKIRTGHAFVLPEPQRRSA